MQQIYIQKGNKKLMQQIKVMIKMNIMEIIVEEMSGVAQDVEVEAEAETEVEVEVDVVEAEKDIIPNKIGMYVENLDIMQNNVIPNGM